MTTVPDSDLLEKTPDEQEPTTSPPKDDPIIENADEVFAALRDYGRALVRVKGWRVAAQELGVSRRTMNLWLKADYVGRLLPQLFGELFDGDLDRLIRETGTLMKQRKWKDDDPAPEADQQQNSPAEHVPSPAPPEDDWMLSDGDDEVGELPDEVEMMDEVAQAVSESESTILTADRREELAQEESEPSEEEAVRGGDSPTQKLRASVDPGEGVERCCSGARREYANTPLVVEGRPRWPSTAAAIWRTVRWGPRPPDKRDRHIDETE